MDERRKISIQDMIMAVETRMFMTGIGARVLQGNQGERQNQVKLRSFDSEMKF